MVLTPTVLNWPCCTPLYSTAQQSDPLWGIIILQWNVVRRLIVHASIHQLLNRKLLAYGHVGNACVQGPLWPWKPSPCLQNPIRYVQNISGSWPTHDVTDISCVRLWLAQNLRSEWGIEPCTSSLPFKYPNSGLLLKRPMILYLVLNVSRYVAT
jgi:hypothetical protein